MSDRSTYPSGAPVFVTPKFKKVARVLLMDPEGLHWCAAVSQAVGLQSGSVSPMLRKLVSIHWLEVVDQSDDDHHPPRVFYRLTEEGEIMLSALVWSE